MSVSSKYEMKSMDLIFVYTGTGFEMKHYNRDNLALVINGKERINLDHGSLVVTWDYVDKEELVELRDLINKILKDWYDE